MSRGRLLFAFYRLCMIIIKIKFENGPLFFYSKVNNTIQWALKRPGLHYSFGRLPKVLYKFINCSRVFKFFP